MCDPVTAAVGFSAATGLMGSYSANQQGKYTARVAEQNAEGLDRAAADASLQGVTEGEQTRNRYQNLIGRQVAGAAASGVNVSTGTPLDLFSETAQLGEYDAQVVESNARRQAYGLKTQAVDQRSQGRLAKKAGRNRAFTTLLSSGAQTAAMGQSLTA